jgi:hypothetical protein
MYTDTYFAQICAKVTHLEGPEEASVTQDSPIRECVHDHRPFKRTAVVICLLQLRCCAT